MTTHATIAWVDPEGDEIARVYVHANGYQCDDELARFFSVEEMHVAVGRRGSRWHDPSYLAARFVAWMIPEHGSGTGIGIVPTDRETMHVHYRWRVDCTDRDKVPTVTRVET